MDRLPDWVTPVLQGTAYWLGMQQVMGEEDTLSEGAIALTIRDLLRRHIRADQGIATEKMYRMIHEYANDEEIAESQTRSDILIFKKPRPKITPNYAPGEVSEIIEIKHHRSPWRQVIEDIDFLGQRRKHSPDSRTFLIYTSINRRPERFTDESGAAVRRILTTDKGTNYRVRRVCRAMHRIPTRNIHAQGHYVLLIEIV